jgi:hypothetical protein
MVLSGSSANSQPGQYTVKFRQEGDQLWLDASGPEQHRG